MRETTISKGGVTGSKPAPDSELSTENQREKGRNTEQSSVETAKVLPETLSQSVFRMPVVGDVVELAKRLSHRPSLTVCECGCHKWGEGVPCDACARRRACPGVGQVVWVFTKGRKVQGVVRRMWGRTGDEWRGFIAAVKGERGEVGVSCGVDGHGETWWCDAEVSHGKVDDGMPVFHDSEPFGAHEGGDDETGEDDVGLLCEWCAKRMPCGCEVAAGKGIPEEEEQPNDKQPPSTPVRICIGIPICQGPGEACDTALGPEVTGERCAVCAEWMRVYGECDGCNGHLPGWDCTGRLCPRCKEIRGAVLRKSVPGAVLLEAFEAAWQALADSSDLEPVTVAVCKRLRDLERGL